MTSDPPVLPASDPIELAARLGPPERHLVVLDFDGTLSSIVDRPELAAPAPGAVDAIVALAARTEVALVSGRPVAELVERLGSLPVTYAGGHGAELLLPDGTSDALVDPDSVAEPLGRAEELVRSLVDDEPGWYVERKMASLAIHHRLAPPESVEDRLPRLHASLEHLADDPPGFTVLEGKAVLELRPSSVDKGQALARIGDRTPGLHPLVVGDDVTDEDAFRVALDRGGHAVLVADASRPSLATSRLADPAEVVRFIAAMAGEGS